MDSNVKISVIIPAYNAEDTIISCIQSILSQTISVFEIVIINDGSTDMTEMVCQDYMKLNNISNLKILTQPNSGPSKARNYGILNSVGNWIAFIDADDTWLHDKIEKQLAVLGYNLDCKLIGTLKYKDKNVNKYYKDISFRSMLYKNSFFTSSIIVERDVLIRFLFDETKRYAEDYKLWLQIVFSNRGIVLNEGLFCYNVPIKGRKSKSLSSMLWKMEMGVVDNFYFLYRNKMINLVEFYSAYFFSLVKFVRRALWSILLLK